MREEDHVVHFDESVRDGRLVCVHVESCAGDPSLLEGIDQGILIDNRAPTHVDQETCRAERLQDFA